MERVPRAKTVESDPYTCQTRWGSQVVTVVYSRLIKLTTFVKENIPETLKAREADRAEGAAGSRAGLAS